MADVIQWTIDQFWSELQSLQSQIQQVDDALNADKVRLGQMYSQAAANYDPSRDAWIAPLIHRNTELRFNYLKPIKDKFNEAVNAAQGAIQAAGYTVPGQLGGMGLIFVPAVAVAAVLVAIAAVVIVWRLTQAQIARTDTLQQLYADNSLTMDQKNAAATALASQAIAEGKSQPPPLGFDFSQLLPLAAIIAAIVLVPPILKMLPKRRAA